MADKMSIEEIADAMFKMIEEYAGKKKFKPNDLPKEMTMQYGEDRVSKDDARKAINMLIDSGRCVYTYFGGTFVEIPHKEAAANE
ncbi:MAG: hypothetical protein AB1422_02330 [bacterium]